MLGGTHAGRAKMEKLYLKPNKYYIRKWSHKVLKNGHTVSNASRILITMCSDVTRSKAVTVSASPVKVKQI